MGSTTFSFGVKDITIPGVAFDVLRSEPEVRDDSVRFVQTVGGRAGFPQPRLVKGSPYFRIQSATAWTTLALTIHADGSSQHELVGASGFPRHWIYDRDGNLTEKSGTVDFKTWYREAHGDNTPWGDEDSEAFVTAAESAVERELSSRLMQGGLAKRRKLEPGENLVEQGSPGDELYLLIDGVLAVDVDGEEVGEIGPGAIVGERALLEDGTRKATLTARTKCRVAVVPADMLERSEMEALSATRGGRQHRARRLCLERCQGGDACRDRHHAGDLNAREPFPKHDICRQRGDCAELRREDRADRNPVPRADRERRKSDDFREAGGHHERRDLARQLQAAHDGQRQRDHQHAHDARRQDGPGNGKLGADLPGRVEACAERQCGGSGEERSDTIIRPGIDPEPA